MSAAPSSSRVHSSDGVHAVVATRGPSDALGVCLQSLLDQEHHDLDIMVVGSALAEQGDGDLAALTAQVTGIAPGAQVVAVDSPGLSAAFNVALEQEIAAPYLLLLHDDVALDADALARLLAESKASSAAIVGPKLVDWDEPRVLVEVGLGADKFAEPVSAIEPGEIDQEQHDAVADVFAVPSAALLVQTETFVQLGGFDDVIPTEGEDVDFGWRALVAGARIVVAPDAVARHQADCSRRWAREPLAVLRPRHQVRTVLGGYGKVRMARVVPQMLVLWAAQLIGALATLDFGRVRQLLGAWTWNLRRLGQAKLKRQRLAAMRVIHDGELRDYQERGSAKTSRFLSTHFVNEDGDSSLAAARQSIAAKLSTGALRNALVAVGSVVAVLIFGSRNILGQVPAFGDFVGYGDPRMLVTEWWSGWWRSGLGTVDPAPTGYAGFGLLGYLFLGATGLLRQLLILGLVPLGLAGVWRLTGPLGSRGAQAVAVVVYAALPVPYNAFAAGSWETLAVYAAMPWVFSLAARLSFDAPYPRRDARTAPLHTAGRIGLVLAIAGWISPLVFPAAALLLVGLLVGSLVAGSMRGMTRLGLVILAGIGLGVALHLPSGLTFLRDGVQWAPIGGAGTTEPGTISAAQLLRFDTGAFSDTPLVWAFLIPPAFALLVGRGWRLIWTVRAWFVALAGWGVAWAAQWGALPVPLPAIELPLVLAGLGVAMASGLGVTAFERDLGRNRFGWRQLAAGAAAGALVIASLPLLAASLDGGWDAPTEGFDDTLASVFDESAVAPGEVDGSDQTAEAPAFDVPAGGPIDPGDFRVLWLGDPALMPMEGWPLLDSSAFALTEGGAPTLHDLRVAPVDDTTDLVRQAVVSASQRRIGRLGSVLAPMGIRYVVIVQANAPGPFATERVEPDVRLVEGLSEQLDLVRLDGVDSSIRLYENQAWVATVAAVPPGSDDVPPVGAWQPILTDRPSPNRFEGPYTPGTEVHLADAADSGWRFEIGGRPAVRSVGFDWANRFTPTEQGDASLWYRTPAARRLALVGQLAGWLLVILAVWVRRERGAR